MDVDDASVFGDGWLSTGTPIGTPPPFELWYKEEYPRLLATLIRLGATPDLAEDTAAEAFSRALQKWSRVGSMTSPTAWTFKVSFNLVRRSARRVARETNLLRNADSHPESSANSDLWEAVASLPRRQKTAIVLHYLLDLPYDEVASVMRIRKGTVAATLAAARSKLKGLLQDGGE